METNRYAAEARERKAHTLAAIIRQDNITDPTDEQIRHAAQGVAIPRPSDETCARVRKIVAAVTGDTRTAADILDDMFTYPATPTGRFTAVRQNDDNSTTTLGSGTFVECRSAVSDALTREASAATHKDIARQYKAGARLVRSWSQTAPTAGPNWEIFVYRFAAQITEVDQ